MLWRNHCPIILIMMSAALLTNCQPSPTPDIEATVQARVAATVAALPKATPAPAATSTPSLLVMPTPVPTATVGPLATATTRARVPYSFERDNFRIILLGIEADPRLGVVGEYRWWQFRFSFENLLNRENSTTTCMEFADLRIRTNQDNIYRPPPSGRGIHGTYHPRQVQTHTIAFQIRAAEQPMELLVFFHPLSRQSGQCQWRRPGPNDPPDLIVEFSGQP